MNTTFIGDLYSKVLEQCLMELLTQYLGRPAEFEDAKRLTIGSFPDGRPLLISIDGHHVGSIKIDFNYNKITATFNPTQ
jgi:hypothetical protein